MKKRFTEILAVSALMLAACVAAAANAAVPLAWETLPGSPAPVSFDRHHGETIDFRCTLRGFGQHGPVFGNDADVRLWYQTNGMGQAWWSAPATVSSNVITATWSPALDPGADRVSIFLGAPSNVYASAVLRLRHSPGFAPASLPLPTPVLDFAAVELRNLHALTNGWSFGGEPGDYATVRDRVMRAVVTNRYGNATVGLWDFPGGLAVGTANDGFRSFLYPVSGGLDVNARGQAETIYHFGFDGVQTADDVMRRKDFSAVSNLAASADAKADTAIAYLQGDDAKVVVTNYDSAVTMPSASLQQRISESGTNYWKIVWNELTRWNRFTGDGFDWAAWCGFDCFRTNVLAQLDQKADRAWGFYDSHTGNWAPDGYTWISSPKIAIAAGLAYQRTITSEGAVWVLESNGLVTETGGNVTNGFFRISDDAGNTLFEIVKGGKRTIGADAGSVTTENVMGVTHLHIAYAVVSESHPTLKICPALELGEWKSEDASDCVANVSWTGSSGAWVAEVWGKTALPRMFVKAEYEVGGETYIKNAAPVSADGGILCTDGIHKVRPVWHSGGSVTWEVVP